MEKRPDFEKWFECYRNGCWLLVVDSQLHIVNGIGHRNRKDVKIPEGCRILTVNTYFKQFLSDIELKIRDIRRLGKNNVKTKRDDN